MNKKEIQRSLEDWLGTLVYDEDRLSGLADALSNNEPYTFVLQDYTVDGKEDQAITIKFKMIGGKA